MVKANEIRHGSIIAFDDGSTDVVKVDYLFKQDDVWFVQWNKISGDGSFDSGNSILQDFKGIPLTPEILEQCGFERYEHNDHFFGYQKNGIKLPFDIDTGEVFMAAYKSAPLFESWAKRKKIYLHQLQNLIFSLTGEELLYQPIKELT